MNRLSPVWLLVVTAGAVVAGFMVTMLLSGTGASSPVLHLSALATMGALAVTSLALGIVVWWDQRRIKQAVDEARRRAREAEQSGASAEPNRSRPERRVDPITAVRVVLLGQAGAYGGALIAGWHLGVLLDLAPSAGMSAPNASNALLLILGGVVLVLVGFVVEQLCKLPPDEQNRQGRATTLEETYRDEFGDEPGAETARAEVHRR